MTRWKAAVVLLTAFLAIGGTQPAQAAPAADLESLRDQMVVAAGPGSAAWVDAKTGQVVVQVADPSKLRLSSARIRVEQAAPAVPYALLYGGYGMRSATGKYCTTGFIAHNATATASYVVTAGHCTANTVYWDRKGDYLGRTYSSVFDGDGDYGVITIKGVTFHARDGVATDMGVIALEGVGTASVGQSVCKKGNNSGYTCGTVLAVDVSVNYGGLVVSGMIQTDVCSVPGDSGSPLMSELIGGELRAWALGVLSGGGGECGPDRRGYYNPLGEILDQYGLILGAA
ncbi:serine protease [Rhizocola hellebori]|uniref:Serine protease n=1 Tax=Rhizocola hellebori TaxID=1392758 RepID=A0A8J3VF61_9ACTN|nr:S1 family peptidase [Rhizocola hellebori]GIH03822.1 serine protease [Rhizocola hellebori]